jgi:hypothetical protein
MAIAQLHNVNIINHQLPAFNAETCLCPFEVTGI